VNKQGTALLARVIDGHARRRAAQPPALDLGTIQAGGLLLLDGFAAAIPEGDYLVEERFKKQHTERASAFGDIAGMGSAGAHTHDAIPNHDHAGVALPTHNHGGTTTNVSAGTPDVEPAGGHQHASDGAHTHPLTEASGDKHRHEIATHRALEAGDRVVCLILDAGSDAFTAIVIGRLE
jgi:hypothetical protein